MDVSVIIINYNTLKMTRECIDSVFKETHGVEFEVILVDNSSNDGSKEWFEQDARIKYIYSDSNLGFGKANNLGYKYAQGKYIFLLNSDTLLISNTILQFYKFMEGNDISIACVGCELIDLDGNAVTSYGEFPSISLILKQRLSHIIPRKYRKYYGNNGPYRKDMGNNAYLVDYITGADLFIRKEVIEQCGLFDPDFFLYYEETEMQYRYRLKDYYSCVLKQLKIIHLEGGSSNKKNNHLVHARKAMCSIFLYMRKTHGIFYYLAFRFLFFLISLPSFLYFRYPIKDRMLYLRELLS